MSPPVKPAMTPEEWEYEETAQRCGEDTLFAYVANGEQSLYPVGVLAVGWNDDSIRPTTPEARHALAALALHGQDFGFTWEDVDMLRAIHMESDAVDVPECRGGNAIGDLADRIAALLAPEGAVSTDLGSWVCLYDEQGDQWTIVVDDERIDAAVSRHVESGGTRDTLLDLTGVEGFPIRIRASAIASWFVSTPETRRRSVELRKLQADEAEEHRASFGIWEDE